MFPFPTNLNEFALWLGLPSAAGVLIALLLERLGAFQALSIEGKKTVTLVVFTLLPFLALVVQWAVGLSVIIPAEPQALVQFALNLALQGLVAWGASQYGHGSDPAHLKKYYSNDALTLEIEADDE